MPRVSIITPTINRARLLPAIWNCVRAQSIQDFEWLVQDGSSRPAPMFDTINDKRVRYMHVPEPMTIGAKRNALCEAANGSIIVQFDDDDYYAPLYIERMLSLMTACSADFVKLFGYFLYHRANDAFAYWDLEHDFPLHYVLEPNATLGVEQYRSGADARWGYGFSYVFYRRVWEAVRFADRNHGEDQQFANMVVARFKSAGMRDLNGLCVHVIHSGNTSRSFPQQILHRPLLAKLFPNFT
jgi:glycosyltransferase involved in cell wall biosynthesis